jgi:hypothetical protein
MGLGRRRKAYSEAEEKDVASRSSTKLPPTIKMKLAMRRNDQRDVEATVSYAGGQAYSVSSKPERRPLL